MAKSNVEKILSPKLPWSMIRTKYRGKWVELVDYDWNWNQAFPDSAAVRHSSLDRHELNAKIAKSGEIPGSAVLYVGPIGASIEFTERALTL